MAVAGCGQTKTFLYLDIIWQQFKTKRSVTENTPIMRKLRKRNNRRPHHKYNLRSKTRGVPCPVCKICGASAINRQGRDPKNVNIKRCPISHERRKKTPCVICLDTVGNKKTRKVLCGHQFHVKCIDSWLKVSDSCPVCRFQLRRSCSILSIVRRLTLSPYLQYIF